MPLTAEMRFRCFRAGGIEFPDLGALIRAAERAKPADDSRRSCPVWGGDARTQSDHYLGDLVVESGVVSFTGIEPDGPEGEE